jgi:hypothetical protein
MAEKPNRMTRRTLLAGAAAAASAWPPLRAHAQQHQKEPGETMTQRKRRSGPGLIFGPGEDGWWDSERVSCPKVMRLADGSWKMWYYGRDAAFDRQIGLPTGRVGLATSSDGIHFTRVRGPLTMGSVFEPHPDPARFDSGHVGVNDVHYRDGKYWMWYFGGDQSTIQIGPGTIKGFPMRPGLALSGDGINWLRVEGPYRGALLDAGKPGDFDALMVAWPQVIPWDDGSWRMYYHTVDAALNYYAAWAESADGLRWEKRGKVLGPSGVKGSFDDRGVATRHIIRLNGRWTMFYEGCRDIGTPMQVDRQIGAAVSDDGVNWERVPGPNADNSVIAASTAEDPWDIRLGCPHVVPLPDGSLRLYYIGSDERDGEGELDTVNQIGVAVSDGDITQWRRWEA